MNIQVVTATSTGLRKNFPRFLQSTRWSWLNKFKTLFKETGWWLTYPSEKYDELRQLGLWHSQLSGKIKQMFQTTNQEIDGFQIVEHILSPNRMNIGVQPISVAWWRMVQGGS